MCRVNSMYFSGTSCAAHVYNSLYKLRLSCHFLSGLQLEHLHKLFSMISTPSKMKILNPYLSAIWQPQLLLLIH